MMTSLVVIVPVLLFADYIFSAPLTLRQAPPSTALDFMQMYGYLDSYGSHSESLYSDAALQDAIKQVQKFGGVTMTGVLDNNTLCLMQSPRCGVKDISNSRTKRYVLGGKGWNKWKITYFIANWSLQLGYAAVDAEIAKAFDTWAKYSGLTFQQITDSGADVVIGFSSGPHGDGLINVQMNHNAEGWHKSVE